MAQMEIAGLHWQATPWSATSATIDSLSSELNSEIHAILDSLTTHPAPTSSKKEPCLQDEPARYSIHTTSATPQHIHPFHMMEQTQYSVSSIDSMTATLFPTSVCAYDPSAVNLDGTHKMPLASTVNCAVELALSTHSQTTPLYARVSQTEPPVPQHPTLLPCLPQPSHPSHTQWQMPQLVGTTEHKSSSKLEDVSWTHSTSQAGSTLTMEDQHAGHDEGERSARHLGAQLQMTEQPWNSQTKEQYIRKMISETSNVLSIDRNGFCCGIQNPLLFQSSCPSKLICHMSNKLAAAGSKTATKLASPNMVDRLSSTPHDSYLSSAGCFTSFLDRPNETASVHLRYSMTETPVPDRHTKYLIPKKKGQRPKRKRSQLGKHSTEDGTYRGMKLWQFLLQLLVENKHPTIICWTSKEEGTFKVIDSEALAKLWGRHKNRLEMNYDKMSRAMRYYYNKNLLNKVPRRLHYQFKYFSKWWERLEAFEPGFKMIRIPEPPRPTSEATLNFLSDSERSDSESPVCSDMEHDTLSPVTIYSY